MFLTSRPVISSNVALSTHHKVIFSLGSRNSPHLVGVRPSHKQHRELHTEVDEAGQLRQTRKQSVVRVDLRGRKCKEKKGFNPFVPLKSVKTN